MNKTHWTKMGLALFVHAFLGWGICGAIIGIGYMTTTKDNTLIIHAIAVPLVFAAISFVYHKYFNYTTPLLTAFIFMAFAMLLDAALVAPVFEKSFDMFTGEKSMIGTWIPFGLIFLSTYLTGLYVSHTKHSATKTSAKPAVNKYPAQ